MTGPSVRAGADPMAARSEIEAPREGKFRIFGYRITWLDVAAVAASCLALTAALSLYAFHRYEALASGCVGFSLAVLPLVVIGVYERQGHISRHERALKQAAHQHAELLADNDALRTAVAGLGEELADARDEARNQNDALTRGLSHVTSVVEPRRKVVLVSALRAGALLASLTLARQCGGGRPGDTTEAVAIAESLGGTISAEVSAHIKRIREDAVDVEEIARVRQQGGVLVRILNDPAKGVREIAKAIEASIDTLIADIFYLAWTTRVVMTGLFLRAADGLPAPILGVPNPPIEFVTRTWSSKFESAVRVLDPRAELADLVDAGFSAWRSGSLQDASLFLLLEVALRHLEDSAYGAPRGNTQGQLEILLANRSAWPPSPDFVPLLNGAVNDYNATEVYGAISKLNHAPVGASLIWPVILQTIGELGRTSAWRSSFAEDPDALNAPAAPNDGDKWSRPLLQLVRRMPRGVIRSVDCGPGWYPLLVNLDAKMSELDPHYTLEQVKDKYAELRFYWTPSAFVSDDVFAQMEHLVEEASDQSTRTCERCGSAGRMRDTGGWYQVLCDTCLSTSGN